MYHAYGNHHHDQRFPFIPFLAGLAVSPFLYGPRPFYPPYYYRPRPYPFYGGYPYGGFYGPRYY